MKSLLLKLGLNILGYLLTNKSVHDKLRELAKKTDNKFDDVAIENVIQYFQDVSELLKKG